MLVISPFELSDAGKAEPMHENLQQISCLNLLMLFKADFFGCVFTMSLPF